MTMTVCTFVFFYIVMFLKISNASFVCIQSTSTIAFVDSCPKDQKQWDLAAKSKGCKTMAALQNCTETDKFQYHCLLNHHKNATLEVCAPIFYLQGYCPIYDTETKEITENYKPGYECLTFSGTDQCPSRYQSSEVYKYQHCYTLQSLAIKTTSTNSGAADTEMRFKDICVPIIVALTVMLVAVLVAVSIYLLVKRKMFTCIRFKDTCKAGNEENTHGDTCKAGNEENTHEDGGQNTTSLSNETRDTGNVMEKDEVGGQNIPLLSKETGNAGDEMKKGEGEEQTTPLLSNESKEEEKEQTKSKNQVGGQNIPLLSKETGNAGDEMKKGEGEEQTTPLLTNESKEEEKEQTKSKNQAPPRPPRQPVNYRPGQKKQTGGHTDALKVDKSQNKADNVGQKKPAGGRTDALKVDKSQNKGGVTKDK